MKLSTREAAPRADRVPHRSTPAVTVAPARRSTAPAGGNAAIHRMARGGAVRGGDLSAFAAGGGRALQRLCHPGGTTATAPKLPVAAKLTVSQPHDPAERQADAVAARVTSGAPAPAFTALAPATVSRAPSAADIGADAPAGLSAALRDTGAGAPLPAEIRAQLEPHLGVDLSAVQVHSGESAATAAAQIGARAFTTGTHIYLGAGESANDVALMAHEATHVAQQAGGTTAVGPLYRDSGSILPDVVLDAITAAAKALPGYTMLTVVAGYDPIANRDVARSPENLVRGVIGLVPFGTVVADKIIELGILQKAFQLVDEGLTAHNLTLARIQGDLDQVWKDLEILKGIDGNVAVIATCVTKLYKDALAFARGVLDAVVQLVRDAAVGLAEKYLVGRPSWDLAKKVLHHDPLRGTHVDAATVDILADFLTLIGKQDAVAQMRERGTLQKTADWLDTQIGRFLGLITELGALFTSAWEAIQPQNIASLPDNLSRLADTTVGLIGRIAKFAEEVIVTVLKLVKDALLGWLSQHAHEIKGFRLLTVILGTNPFTHQPVARNAENLIGGFIALLPGGEETYQKLAEAGVIAEAGAQIEAAMGRLGISVEMIAATFQGVWHTLTLEDLLNPIGAFTRVLDKFGEPLGKIVAFAGEVIKVVITLILKLMNFPTELLGSIITNAMAAIEDIKRDPVAFLLNMIAALKTGFMSFLDKVLGYLLNGLADWLFRGLGALGIKKPPDLSFKSILELVLQVLDVTTDKLWTKLGKHIGEDVVAKIRAGVAMAGEAFDFVKDVQENGVAAIWEHVESQLGNLWDTLLGMAKDWIVTTIIEKATAKLLSMLDPTGIMAVVNSGIAFFNAVQSVIEYVREILTIVNDYVSTLAAVAAGNITAGAQKVEKGLAGAIPVAIGFLANQAGLGDIPEKLVEMIGKLRELVDKALDWLFEKAARMGKAALNALGMGHKDEMPDDEGGPWDPDRVKEAARKRASERLAAPHSRQDIDAILAQILAEYQNRGLVSLGLGPAADGGEIPLIAVASPPEKLLALTPARRKVRMIATLVVTGDPLAGVTPQPGRRFVINSAGDREEKERLHTPLPPTNTEGKGGSARGAHGGYLIPPAIGSDTLEVVTWNTGELDPKVKSNASHAESQFAQWAKKPENRQLLARTSNLTIDMYDWSPCAACGSDLKIIKGWMPSNATATLIYREVYPGDDGLAILLNAQWIPDPRGEALAAQQSKLVTAKA